MRIPLNIGRAAFALIRLYGDDSVGVALRRSQLCARRNEEVAAAEWRLVVRKIDELLLAQREGPGH
jgi:hypothetical protein